MKFKGETTDCEICGRTFREDEMGGSEEDWCKDCLHEEGVKWSKEPCVLCGKPHGYASDKLVHNEDEQVAHKKCVENMTKEEKKEFTNDWSDDWDQ